MNDSPICLLGVMLLYIVICIIYSRYYRLSSKKRSFSFVGIVLIMVFCMFPVYDGDYFHYMELYERLYFYPDETHLEEFYKLIAPMTGSYTCFRMFIWGAALLVFSLIIKVLKVNKNLAFSFFACMYLPIFAYSRVSLAIAGVMLGVACFINSDKLGVKILAFLMILIALPLHKSSPLILPVMLCALIMSCLPRKALWFIWLLVPVLSKIVGLYVMPEILTLDVDDSNIEQSVNSMNMYMESDKVQWSLGYYLKKLLEYLSYYMSALIALVFLTKSREDGNYPAYIRSLALIIVSIVYISTIFLLNNEGNTFVMFYRLLNFLIIPVPVFFALLYQSGWHRRLIRINLYLGLCASLYWLSYSLYAAL